MNKLREIYDKNAKEHIELPYGVPFMLREDFEQAIADYEKSKWKTGFPDLIEGKHFSDNVIAEVEGYADVQVMCVFELTEDGRTHLVWANCNGDIYGEGEYDDNYNVIRWTEIPTTPKP